MSRTICVTYSSIDPESFPMAYPLVSPAAGPRSDGIACGTLGECFASYSPRVAVWFYLSAFPTLQFISVSFHILFLLFKPMYFVASSSVWGSTRVPVLFRWTVLWDHQYGNTPTLDPLPAPTGIGSDTHRIHRMVVTTRLKHQVWLLRIQYFTASKFSSRTVWAFVYMYIKSPILLWCPSNRSLIFRQTSSLDSGNRHKEQIAPQLLLNIVYTMAKY